tara:strand:+ start:2167 stop:2385 length:219 start_codon:yes stop_codon:yes gene_type:complete
MASRVLFGVLTNTGIGWKWWWSWVSAKVSHSYPSNTNHWGKEIDCIISHQSSGKTKDKRMQQNAIYLKFGVA